MLSLVSVYMYLVCKYNFVNYYTIQKCVMYKNYDFCNKLNYLVTYFIKWSYDIYEWYFIFLYIVKQFYYILKKLKTWGPVVYPSDFFRIVFLCLKQLKNEWKYLIFLSSLLVREYIVHLLIFILKKQKILKWKLFLYNAIYFLKQD